MEKQKKLHYVKLNGSGPICGNPNILDKECYTSNLETFAKSDRRCGNCERVLKKDYSWIGLFIPAGFDFSEIMMDAHPCRAWMYTDEESCAPNKDCGVCLFGNGKALQDFLAWKEAQEPKKEECEPFNTTPADVKQNQEAGKFPATSFKAGDFFMMNISNSREVLCRFIKTHSGGINYISWIEGVPTVGCKDDWSSVDEAVFKLNMRNGIVPTVRKPLPEEMPPQPEEITAPADVQSNIKNGITAIASDQLTITDASGQVVISDEFAVKADINGESFEKRWNKLEGRWEEQPPEITAQQVADALRLPIRRDHEVVGLNLINKQCIEVTNDNGLLTFHCHVDIQIRKIHKEPELVYCMQFPSGKWLHFDRLPPSWRDRKYDDISLFSDSPIATIEIADVRYQVLTVEYDGVKEIWLGFINDGPKEQS
jgi:hypothetical protein